MDRFEYRRTLSRRSRRQQSHRATDAGTLVRQNITKRIFRNHYVKEFRLLNHLHGGVVHKHIVGCHLGVLRCHLLGNLSPKTGRGKHIGFIHHRKMFTAFHGIFKSDFQDTLNLRTGIHVRIIRLVIVLVFLTEVHATGQFADAKEIGTIHQFRTKGRLMEQTFEGLHGTDVGKQSQFLAHSQQALLGTHFGSRVIVEFRVTYGREQYSIRIFTSLISGFGKRVTHLVYRVCTADGIFIVHFMSELLTHGSHHIHAYGRDFGADTVTGQHCNFKIHCFLYYLKVHLSSFCLQDSCGDTDHPTQNLLSI